VSVQQAHAFIRYVREHPGELQPPEEPSVAWAVEAGKKLGFSFSEVDLRTAHRQDWALRRLAAGSQADDARS
jgi:hypothetical protein